MIQIALENHLYTSNGKLDVQSVYAHIDPTSALRYTRICHMNRVDVQSMHAHMDLPSALQHNHIYHMD